jgi:transketolase
MMNNIDMLTINTLRLLSVDSVQKANSGHPGLPMGAAPTAYALWGKIMKHNPLNPNWENRDRFVLSAGHGSTLLYSLLHLFGYGLQLDDLKNFRQLDSLTPGHPEYKHTSGVEITTGPLGQGIANAVGMAWAESHLSAKFNKPNKEIVDHFTYVICGDGCLMEGISAEAASLAGTLGLGKLVLLYDSNNISIEGSTDIAFTENVLDRFKSYNWHTQLVQDGNNLEEILNSIENAKNETTKPSIIEIKTLIGHGSPNKQGKASAHGEPLGNDEISLTKKGFNWESTEDFYIPENVKTHIQLIKDKLSLEEIKWNELLESYKKEYPELYKEWVLWNTKDIDEQLLLNDDFWNYEGDIATRISSEQVLNKVCKLVPNLIGGSADLAPSTKTIMKERTHYSKDNTIGSNLHFGVREHAMTAIANGMVVHGGLRVYISGFFVFSDYMKPAMRLSALMGLPVINILTHDSIGVGEDGPTHQPIEHLAALRATPDFTVLRPCDTNETAAAWYLALTRNSPSALVLSRQNLKLQKETGKSALKGGYILKDSKNPKIILMGSGSEIDLLYKAYEQLSNKGIDSRIVSMMSFEVFEEQTVEYKESVLPNNIRLRVAVEAGSSLGWHKYTGLDGAVIAIDSFGASAPAEQLFVKYGFTVEAIVNNCLNLLKIKG